MILDEIMSRIGEKEFFKESDLQSRLNLSDEDTKKFISEGLNKEILIEVSNNEYAFSENTIENRNKQNKEDFSKFIDSNIVISSMKGIRLNLEETELKDSVLEDLAVKRRADASESLVFHIERHNYIYTTRDDNQSEMWIYQNGIYVPEGKTYVREFCRKIIGSAYKPQFVNEVIAKIEADTLIEAKEFFNQNYIDEVPVLNGVLNIKTKELSIYNPRKIFFNKLPIYYDPTAKCPKITKHFETVLRNKEDAKVLFELFGYLLLKENRLEKSFMFVGNGRNGKSKTLELVKKFVGVENCSALPLSSMNSESFSLSELFGKMANLSGDLSYMDLKETGVLKQLIGRDEIQTKRKFKRDLNFVNYSKLLFATNELPRIYDMTDGFWTKWILLEFPYKFITQKEYDELPLNERANKKIIDTEIIDKISSSEELSGLLNEALNSLDIILEQKEFSYSHGTTEVKDMWIRQSDSFMAFCMDNIEEDYNEKISKKDLKKAYMQFCKKYRLRSSTEKSMKITLENMYGVVECRMSDTSHGWDGITLKKKEEKEDESIKNIKNIKKHLKDNQDKAVEFKDLYAIFPNKQELTHILENLAGEGLIYSPKDEYWQYLG